MKSWENCVHERRSNNSTQCKDGSFARNHKRKVVSKPKQPMTLCKIVGWKERSLEWKSPLAGCDLVLTKHYQLLHQCFAVNLLESWLSLICIFFFQKRRWLKIEEMQSWGSCQWWKKLWKRVFKARQRVPWWSLEERLNFEYSLKKKVDALRENKKSLNWNQFEDTAKIKMCFVAFMACLYHGFILLQYLK